MNEFLQAFSNREISIVYWSITCLIILLFSQRKDLKQIGSLIKMLFNKYFVLIYFITGIYFYFILKYLNRIGIWEISLYKDFMFWLLTVLTPIKQEYYFKFRFLIKRLIFSFLLDVYPSSISPLE
jgi:hypothetical protein